MSRRKDIPGQGFLFHAGRGGEYADLGGRRTRARKKSARARAHELRALTMRAVAQLASEQRFIRWQEVVDRVRELGYRGEIDDAVVVQGIDAVTYTKVVVQADGPEFLESVELCPKN